MHPVAVPIEFLAPGLIFAAGGFYFVVRTALVQITRDLNGVGRKMGELKELSNDTRYRNAVVLLATCPAEQRERIASWLLR